jgi:hypothetical protein
MRHLIMAIATIVAVNGGSTSAFSFDDVEYWIGVGSHRAALVIDWSDGDPHPPLVWGYRFDDTTTSETMLRAMVAADQRLYARLGSDGPLGVPLYGIGFDRNGNGFELSDGTTFDHGIAITGPSDGATAVDPFDSYAEGWFDGFWALFLGNGEPYAGGQWDLAGTGISARTLADGDWDGLRFADAAPIAPRLPIAAVRRPATAASHGGNPLTNGPRTVPEPTFALWMLLVLAALFAPRPARPAAQLVLLISCIGWVERGAECLANGFAATVVQYVPGTGVGAGLDDPLSALGPATRFTSPADPFGGPVTPFNAPYGIEELVTIGFGGWLTVGFDQPVFDRNRPDEFGFDLIIFGNSFYLDADFPNGIVAGISEEPGVIDVSQDGTTWWPVVALADTAFPTMGYQDVVDAFPAVAGEVLTDFHRPVDPTIDPIGMSMPELISAYAGSGGGTGVDIADTGLEWIQYVRISNHHPPASGVTPEIDAISVVPEPACMAILIYGALAWTVLPVARCRR